MNRNIRARAITLLMVPALFALDAWGAETQERHTSGRVRSLDWVELLPDSEREAYIPGPPPPSHRISRWVWQ